MPTNCPATLLADFYKISHRVQYPKGTEYVYSTWTPRTSRMPNIEEVVAFGFQGFILEYLIDYFNTNFFSRPKKDVLEEYIRVVKFALGDQQPDVRHIDALWTLGYLPIRIKAVPEGTAVPIKVPMLTIENTLPDFYWLTNFLETLMSCCLWQPSTSATIAREYRRILNKWAEKTSSDPSFVQFQGHDFSMRGLSSLQSVNVSGAGHLLSFVGTDTIPAIHYLENYYNTDIEKELVGCSVPATEHSVSSAGGFENEFETYRRLIEDVYPNGIVSIVSDTWDLWNVLTNFLPKLKDKIMARDGKVVIRPDSGDPVKIICGDLDADPASPAYKGVIELLWDTFGGTRNAKGYRELDQHIGAIYGDAITLERCERICSLLSRKGFASTNIVFGIGSFTYQLNTRDTYGFALKSTHCVINGKEHNIFKNPITDDGVKKSQTGRVVVKEIGGKVAYIDSLSIAQQQQLVEDDILQPIFLDGHLLIETTLADIRKNVMKTI